MYKIYCSIINKRLSNWIESNDKLVDEQNGFRKGRSTNDQISALTNIIETRQKRKLSTFAAFIDFKKAYDLVDRNILWNRLLETGIKGKLFSAIRSLYNSVKSCVRINGLKTGWFDVNIGLRQGCNLSPILFNLFINDFAVSVKALGKGIDVGNEKVCILMYADDLVLLADNEIDLQLMLDNLSNWCLANHMLINPSKSQIVHFRQRSVPCFDFLFTCGTDQLNIVEQYVYLGLTLTEFLDYNVTAKLVSQSAGRALGLLIAKFKSLGGMPFDVYSKLYDSLVWPVIAYGAALWGDRTFACIDAVQNRAMRFYLGVGRYTPTAAVAGDMGWEPTIVKQWKCVGSFWSRLCNMDNSRLTKKIFLYSFHQNDKCKNWTYRVSEFFKKLNCNEFLNIDQPISKRKLSDSIRSRLMQNYLCDWKFKVNSEHGTRRNTGNKLRKYKLLKDDYRAEQYCKILMSQSHRAAFAKFRAGVAPLRIETGRYEGLHQSRRVCPFCPDYVEDEYHVIFDCDLYNELRQELFQTAVIHNPFFANMPNEDKFIFLFSNPLMIRLCAKTRFLILQRRQLFLCK